MDLYVQWYVQSVYGCLVNITISPVVTFLNFVCSSCTLEITIENKVYLRVKNATGIGLGHTH